MCTQRRKRLHLLIIPFGKVNGLQNVARHDSFTPGLIWGSPKSTPAKEKETLVSTSTTTHVWSSMLIQWSTRHQRMALSSWWAKEHPVAPAKTAQGGSWPARGHPVRTLFIQFLFENPYLVKLFQVWVSDP